MGFSLGGLVGGGMAGAGQAGMEVAQSQIDAGNRLNLAQAMSDMEVQKAKLIAQNNVDMQNQQRTAQVGRIDTAMGGLVDSAVARKYGSSFDAQNAAATGQTDAPLTDEQQAVIAQNQPGLIAADRDKLMTDPNVRLAAAAQTGDLDLNTQANTNARMIGAEARADAMRYGADSRNDASKYSSDNRLSGTLDTNATRELTTDAKTQSAEKIAAEKVKAAAAKVSQLNPVDKATLEQAQSYDRDNRLDDGERRRLMDSLQSVRESARPPIQAQIEAISQGIKDRQAKRDALLTKSSEAFTAYRAVQAAQQAPLAQTPTAAGRLDPATAAAQWKAQQ